MQSCPWSYDRRRAGRLAGRLMGLLAPALLLAALGCREDPQAPATPEAAAPEPGASALATATAGLSFRQVDGGLQHTCGVTSDDRAYCWGLNTEGQLGDGTTTSRLRPVAVAGTLRFRAVSAGGNFTCGVTTDNRAYCWGVNGFGQLGDGTTTNRTTPRAVLIGLSFRQVSTGGRHTCGVTVDPDVNLNARAYCWGSDDFGQLGTGGGAGSVATPLPVNGGLRFRAVAAGGLHTCGVTTEDRAYCWGLNEDGQVGDSTEVAERTTPVRVAGGRRCQQVAAGDRHSCGVTTDDRAFCWGDGRQGQLGNGKTYLSFWPRRVAGGLSFERMTAGFEHSCGETTLNRAYCWGGNPKGQLGDGTTTTRLTPVAVAGGRFFVQLSAGTEHSCGVTSAAVGFCWGWNQFGQLGDGTTTDRPLPTRIGGPM